MVFLFFHLDCVCFAPLLPPMIGTCQGYFKCALCPILPNYKDGTTYPKNQASGTTFTVFVLEAHGLV